MNEKQILEVKINGKETYPMTLLLCIMSKDNMSSYSIYSTEDNEHFMINTLLKNDSGTLETNLFLEASQLQDFFYFVFTITGAVMNDSVKNLIEKTNNRLQEKEFKVFAGEKVSSKMKKAVHKWNNPFSS